MVLVSIFACPEKFLHFLLRFDDGLPPPPFFCAKVCAHKRWWCPISFHRWQAKQAVLIIIETTIQKRLRLQPRGCVIHSSILYWQYVERRLITYIITRIEKYPSFSQFLGNNSSCYDLLAGLPDKGIRSGRFYTSLLSRMGRGNRRYVLGENCGKRPPLFFPRTLLTTSQAYYNRVVAIVGLNSNGSGLLRL